MRASPTLHVSPLLDSSGESQGLRVTASLSERGRLAYEMTSGVTAGVNISYDKAFDTRVSADIKVRFGGAATTAQRKDVQQLPVINALTLTPSNRDVRVHDKLLTDEQICSLDSSYFWRKPLQYIQQYVDNKYVYIDCL